MKHRLHIIFQPKQQRKRHKEYDRVTHNPRHVSDEPGRWPILDETQIVDNSIKGNITTTLNKDVLCLDKPDHFRGVTDRGA